MEPIEFCRWLQGYFEITEADETTGKQKVLTRKQTEEIKRHLGMVFNREPNNFVSKGFPVVFSPLHNASC